jgi:hypothetical protein
MVDLSGSSTARDTGRKFSNRKIADDQHISPQRLVRLIGPHLRNEQREERACIQVQTQ